MDRVGAIILAAGLSRRMEARNKMLLPIHGVPMIRHVAATYLAAVDGEVCVVTGYDAERVDTALSGLPVRIVHNPAYEQGQPFSVRAGLMAAPNAEHILIGLGDQPRLTTNDLCGFIDAHLATTARKISIPMRDTKRGNPIIVPAAMRSQLLADEQNPGCGKFTRTHPERAQQVPVMGDGFFDDIDTPAAFAAFQHMTSEGVTP